MKRLVLLTIAICLAEFAFSQIDFRKGYVITSAGDTLFGLVDYREGFKAFESCDFKKSEDQNTITYKPSNVIGYGYENDKVFQSREILIKEQPPKVVFLEVIVKGLVSLFKFDQTFFIEKNDSGLQQLINETKEVNFRGKTKVKYTKQYVGTINILLSDCAQLKAKIQEIELDEKELTYLIEDYNRCMGASAINFKANKLWTKAVIGMTGGVNISQLNFDSYRGYEHLAGVFEVSKSPIIGISLDAFTPRVTERFSVHADILYLTSKYYNYNQISNHSSTEINYVTIELHQLKIPIGVRYTSPQRNYTPYFNIGISNTIHLSSNAKWVQEVESNSVVRTYDHEALAIRKNQFGLWGGCGALKSISTKLNAFVELRYERTNGIAQNSIDSQKNLQSKISNFQILVGIRTK